MNNDEWRRLGKAVGASKSVSLAEAFASEPERVDRLSLTACRIFFDFSKTHLSRGAVEAFLALAGAAGFTAARDALFAGEPVNTTENRAATHVAERGAGRKEDVAAAARARSAMKTVYDRVGQGDFGPVRHIIHIGIGGSALGPALVLGALGERDENPDVHIVSNIDGVSLSRAMAACDPATTLIICVSKSFTTLETMTNARSALAWLAASGIGQPKSRLLAITAAPEKAAAWGVHSSNILPFAETVGGRYSLWTSVGLAYALALGWGAYEALLEGAAAMDAHFGTADLQINAPFLGACVDLAYAVLLGAETRAVFAYDERLALLPAFLQQLEMESNGKRVRRDGQPLARPSSPIVWGGTGTDAQHAVFQLLHQGTHLVPAEFIAVTQPGHDLEDVHHRQLLTNCIAQSAALMRGRSYEEALAETGAKTLASAKTFPGDRPSTTIMMEVLDARALGALLAFYEHRTFTFGALLGINSFDQMGVELGKDVARAIAAGDLGELDPSSRELLFRAGLSTTSESAGA